MKISVVDGNQGSCDRQFKTILVTGGAGYIGSHTCLELLNAGHEVVVFDNFSNSSPKAIERVSQLANKQLVTVEGNIRDQAALEQALQTYRCKAVVYFAGLKAVGESVQQPMNYYDNNFLGTHRLLLAMQNCDVRTLVFSSSATVYGEPQHLPIAETHPLSATNPYGRSKLFIEDMLRDLHRADPQGVPNNLMPFVAQVAVGLRPQLQIWGNDYPTPDGTGVRDYIHVVDLAQGHVKALAALAAPQCIEVNLGTGTGYSVLDVVRAFEAASGQRIACHMAARRPGDVASCYADPSLAQQHQGWTAQRDLSTMCQDHWNW